MSKLTTKPQAALSPTLDFSPVFQDHELLGKIDIDPNI